MFHVWEAQSCLKEVLSRQQISRTSMTQDVDDLDEFRYRFEWFEKLTIHVKDAIDECLRIFSIHDDNMFDFFIKRFLIINCTISFNDNTHRLEALIDIDAIDYAFIDREIAQLVCNMLSMKSISLLKSKFLIEFDDRHASSIIYVIYFKLTIKLHFELIALLLIIDLDSHSIILEKSWMNKHRLIVKSSFKLEWVDLTRLASRKFRLELEFESSSSSWHARRFELESNLKSKRQDLTWAWLKLQVSMSNLTWLVKSFNFMTYYIISRYF